RKNGCRAEYVLADLADLDQTRAVMAVADRVFGRVDTLVNAAGITDRGTVFDTSPELFERMMAVNLRAPFFLMQDAAKIMRREKTAAEQPFGRRIDPNEAARAVAFLAGEESGMMTGVNVDYDQTAVGCWESAPHPTAPA